MNNTTINNGGIGFVGTLTIAFVVLKLCKIIDWSWWWVLCPLWAGIAIVVFFVLTVLLFALGASTFEKTTAKTRSTKKEKNLR